jgi:hypothetical protein
MDMTIQRYELHRFCQAFRRANTREKDEMVASMKSYGYDKEQPITLYEGMILDGAGLQDAAEQTGVEPTFATFTGSEDEAIAFVIHRNKARKHMTVGELDLAGARLVTAKRGGQPGRPSNYASNAKTCEMVAKELGRSKHTIAKARTVINQAAPNIIAMIEADEVSASAAYAICGKCGKTKDEQAQMTAADVRKAANAYKSKSYNTRGKLKLKPAPKPKPLVKLSDLDIGTERIPGQPVQLWPARIQRLQEAAIRVAGVAGRVTSFTSIDSNGFAEDLERLLAYQPVVGKKNGEERDFAREARKSLATIEQHIEKAINRLAELRAVIANRAKEKAS